MNSPLSRVQECAATAENWGVSLVLGAVVSLPLAETLLRKTVHAGIPASASLIQHLTLIAGMMGGAIAARENRLLALSTLGNLFKGRPRTAITMFSNSCAAVIALCLCVAGCDWVASEFGSGHVLVRGIPLWTVQALLPAGFLAIALRLLWYAAESWTGRALAAALVTATMLVCAALPQAPQRLFAPALAALAVATALGVPAFVTLGGTAMALFWHASQPLASIAVAHYSLVTNPSLPAMPLFTLAGYFLAGGGAPARLVQVFDAVLGRIRGGPAIAAAVACAFFTTFTGGSGVTILALGGLLLPVLLAGRYGERDALGLITGAGSLGLLFPPCLPLILYAIVAGVPLKQMFLGGLLPGLVMLIAIAWWGAASQAPPPAGSARRALKWSEAKSALWEAKWELLLPVVALAALFSGFATPVEAAAVTALYAFVVECLIYRDLSFAKLPRVLSDCGLLIGGVLLILGVALGLTNYLVDAEVTVRVVEWTTRTIHSRWVFLLALNLFLLIVGCLMDIYSAIVIQVPLLVPIGAAFHVDPVHLGVIFLANLELGYLTPPVGLNLFLSSYRFQKPVGEVLRAAAPAIVVLSLGVLLITYLPALTTALPQRFGR